MDIHELLRMEAETLNREVHDDDRQAFIRRLEERLAAGGRQAADRTVGRSGPPPATARPPAAPRPPCSRPNAADPPKAVRAPLADLLGTLEQLCAVVMANASPGEIDEFFASGRASGATVAACLLYSLGSYAAADTLWRVADAGKEPLAAHFLLLYYTTTGQVLLAQLWRGRTQVIRPQYLPELPLTPLGDPTELAQELTTRLDRPTLGTLSEMTPTLGALSASIPSRPAFASAPPVPAAGVRVARTISSPSRRRRRVSSCPPPHSR